MRITFDSSYVDDELLSSKSLSDGFRKRLFAKLEEIQRNPSCCEPLEDVPPDLSEKFIGLTLRKAKITSGAHDWRIIYAHWILENQDEHVDLLFAFDRRAGYPTLDQIGDSVDEVGTDQP